MPPKKKKGSKKSGKATSAVKKENEVTAEDMQFGEPELNKTFFLLHIKDLERKLKLYKEKAGKFQRFNDEYMKKQKELSQEKHDLISFLEKNLMNRGDEFSDLKDRYFGLQQAKEAEKNQYEYNLQEIRSKLQETKDQLTAEISIISAKLAALEEFKVQKATYLEEYSQLEQVLANKKAEHQKVLENIQGKSSNDHDRLKKEIVSRINTVAAEFRRISQKQTSETTKRTIRENVSIRTQLAKMNDKNIELIQENEQMRLNSRASSKRIKELNKINNELAAKNLSHNRILNLLMSKHQEHQDIIRDYQNEVNVVQIMEIDNQNIKVEINQKSEEIKALEDAKDSLSNEIVSLNNEMEEITCETDTARAALIEAVHHLRDLIQSVPTTISSGSEKSTQSVMTKRGLSHESSIPVSDVDIKEWGTFQQRAIAQDKLQQLLDALDYEETMSRSSPDSEINRKSRISTGNEFKNSPSISIGSRNASAIKRITPVLKEERSNKGRSQIKILSDYEIKTQARLHALKKSKGFFVPGLLQVVPHMSKHIPTNLEKTQLLNRKLNGLNNYRCEDDIEKPIKSNFLKPLDEKISHFWTEKLTG